MNRLQIVQAIARESGATSAAIATTVNVTGEALRFVGWGDAAWNELQTRREDWGWMRSNVQEGAGASFPTVAGQAVYPLGTGSGTVGIAADNFVRWDRHSFRSRVRSVGVSSESFMAWMPYETWRDGLMYGAQQTVQTRPDIVSIASDMSVCLGPPPNGLYTVVADYFRAPTAMAANIDTPTGLPTRFHMLIVYLALIKAGMYLSAPDVIQRGQYESTKMMATLERQYAPEFRLGGALA